MEMTFEVPAPEFDLAKTLNSGQVFHWIAADGGFYGLIGELPVHLKQRENTLIIRLSKNHRPDPDAKVRHYFALDHLLGDICRSFPNDPVMNAAADYCRGLRIIRQPKWECLATFICSSMKQVAHIRQMSQALRRSFGEQCQIDNRLLYTFPGASVLAERSESDLRACALGYRAKNLLATARAVASGGADLDRWSELTDDELRKNLCELAGVGAKVANCVMLFAYERLTAFPIDVWIERVLRERYFAGKRKPTAATLKQFSAEYFGKHGGYAQQYLFHHARTASGRTK